MSTSDFNAKTIAEFRQNHGKVGGQFDGWPLLLLHHTGAHTRKLRVNPMVYLRDGNRYLVFASKGGAPTNPDWYHNLKANPEVKIEVGDDTIEVRAKEVVGEERDMLFARQAKLYPVFSDYQSKTKRKIPIVALTLR